MAFFLLIIFGSAVYAQPVIRNAAVASPGVSGSNHIIPAAVKPAVAAIRYDYNKYSDKDPAISRIVMNSQGIKVADVRTANGPVINEFIQNFERDQVWLVSRRKQQYVSFNASSVSPDDEALAQAETAPSGLMTHAPCVYGVKNFQANMHWHGMAVQSWQCTASTKRRGAALHVKQLFSLDWQMVVREELADGSISELRRISWIKTAKNQFIPDQAFKEVSADDFIADAEQLELYEGVVQ